MRLVACCVLFLTACQRPEFPACAWRCGAEGACPEGTTCVAGFCQDPAAPVSCDLLGTLDAPVSDGAEVDVAPPDAAPPDASPPDAVPPPDALGCSWVTVNDPFDTGGTVCAPWGTSNGAVETGGVLRATGGTGCVSDPIDLSGRTIQVTITSRSGSGPFHFRFVYGTTWAGFVLTPTSGDDITLSARAAPSSWTRTIRLPITLRIRDGSGSIRLEYEQSGLTILGGGASPDWGTLELGHEGNSSSQVELDDLTVPDCQ